MSLGEFDLIDRYFRREARSDSVVHGVGDDGAVLRPSAGLELVAAVDSLVDGVHFPSNTDPNDVGWRVAAVNLSDMAAMGAVPRWATLALTLPNVDEDWLGEFSNGLLEALDHSGTALVGGDTTRGDQLVITLQVLGEVATGKALTRSGARPGDSVFVSGFPGDAAAGLRRLQGGADADDALVRRFCRPTPRLALGQRLAPIASAAIDVSDGLYADLARLAQASGVGAVLDVTELPLSEALLDAFPDSAASLALSGGDDYELCFTVPPDHLEAVQSLAGELEIRLTRIGEIDSGNDIRCLNAGEDEIQGFDHFRELR